MTSNIVINNTENRQRINKAKISTFVMFLVFGLAISSWAPMVPYAKARLEMSEAALGLILLTFGIGALLAMPLTGWLVHRFGSRIVTFIGTPLMICLLPALTIASTPLMLSITLFFFGALSGTLNVAINAHAATVETLWRRPIMSRFHCLFSLGGLAGAGIVSFLLECGYPLFVCSVSLSALLLLLTVIWCGQFLSLSTGANKVLQEKCTTAQESMLSIALVCFIFFLIEGSMLDWSGVFLRDIHGYDMTIAGIGYAAFSVAMASGRFIGDWLVQRFGPSNIVQKGSLVAASGLLVCVTAWDYGVLLGFLLIGLGAANVVPVLFSAAGKTSQTSAGVALAMVTTMGYAGLLLGPVLIGFIAHWTNLSCAFTCASLLLMAVALSTKAVIKNY